MITHPFALRKVSLRQSAAQLTPRQNRLSPHLPDQLSSLRIALLFTRHKFRRNSPHPHNLPFQSSAPKVVAGRTPAMVLVAAQRSSFSKVIAVTPAVASLT